MIIIGERINASRPPVKEALEKRDKEYIQKEASLQTGAGSQYLDLNCALGRGTEADDMEWLVKTVREATDTPLCIDSPDPAVIKRGLSFAGGKPLINSITAEESRYAPVIPLAVKHKSGIIALTMDESGMPDNAQGRFEAARKIFGILKSAGIADEDIFFDPLVRPVSSEPQQAQELLKAIPMIKSLGNVRVACGVSNVSYGLPKRRLVNSAFLSMALSAGLDGALIDPLDKAALAAVRASGALLGRDRYCMDFIRGHRKGLY